MKKITKSKIYFEDLPHYEHGANKGKLDWDKFSGHDVRFEYNDIVGVMKIVSYDKQNRKLKILYKDKIYETYQSSFLKEQIGCAIGIKANGFRYSIGENIVDNNHNITILDRIRLTNKRRKYQYRCNICGNIDWCHEQTINNGKYICNVCANQKLVEGVNDIPTTDPWMIPYFQGGYDEAKQYMSNSKTTIYPICPDCGQIKKKKMAIYTIKRTKSIGCICGDGVSYPNKFMHSLLTQLNINFESEYSPDWISPKRYDFYVPSLNLIIEIDGGLGHVKKVHNNSNTSLNESLEIDFYKDNMASKHNLKVIRIECDKSEFNYIVPKIKESLKNYFDLSEINWERCESYALSNRVKFVCEEYEKYKPILTSELADILYMNKGVVNKYLQKGSMLGWTDYDKKQMTKAGLEKSKSYMKATYSKTVYVYDTSGKFIREYPSLHDVQANSINDFGFFLSYKVVSKCCNGKLNSYKGLIFTYEKEKINLDCDMRRYNREVICYDLEMNFICKYSNATEASKTTNISSQNIRRCCIGNRKTAGGYIWKYADEVEN